MDNFTEIFDDLSALTEEDLTNALQAIPPSVTQVFLYDNFSFQRKTALKLLELITIFGAMPPSVIALGLYIRPANSIWGNSAVKLKKMFDALPPSVAELRLPEIYLDETKEEDLVKNISALPPSVKKLELMYNSKVGYQEKQEKNATLVKIFQAIPSSVKELALHDLDPQEAGLAEIIRALPPSVAELSVCHNHLGYQARLAAVFPALPSSVTALVLSGNYLGNKTAVELAEIFRTLPTSVTKLDLTDNGLDTAKLVAIFGAIASHSVTALRLAWFALSYKTAAELAEIFRALPSSVTGLNLTNNDFGRKTATELAEIFRALPSSVTELNLTGNDFNRKTAAELAEIFRALPPFVTVLRLGNNKLLHPIMPGRCSDIELFFELSRKKIRVLGVEDQLSDFLTSMKNPKNLTQESQAVTEKNIALIHNLQFLIKGMCEYENKTPLEASKYHVLARQLFTIAQGYFAAGHLSPKALASIIAVDRFSEKEEKDLLSYLLSSKDKNEIEKEQMIPLLIAILANEKLLHNESYRFVYNHITDGVSTSIPPAEWFQDKNNVLELLKQHKHNKIYSSFFEKPRQKRNVLSSVPEAILEKLESKNEEIYGL